MTTRRGKSTKGLAPVEVSRRTEQSEQALLLDLKEGAEFTGLTRHKLYRRIAEGNIPADIILRIGGRVYLKRRPLEDWLGVHGAPPTDGRTTAGRAGAGR